MVTASDDDVRIGSVRDLRHRSVEAGGVVDRRVLGEAHGHPLDEGAVVVGAGDEGPPERLHDPVFGRDGAEDVLQRPATRPPELVRVSVDDPVGAVVGCRKPRHARDPFPLAQALGRLGDQPQHSVAFVCLEHVRRAVARVVVGRDHVVDAGIEVERDLCVDDVDLVAREDCEDELHARRRSFFVIRLSLR